MMSWTNPRHLKFRPRLGPLGRRDLQVRIGLVTRLRGRDSNPDYLIQSQASYH